MITYFFYLFDEACDLHRLFGVRTALNSKPGLDFLFLAPVIHAFREQLNLMRLLDLKARWQIPVLVQISVLSLSSIWLKQSWYSLTYGFCFFILTDEHFNWQHKHIHNLFTCKFIIGPGAELAGLACVFIKDVLILFTRGAGPTATDFSFTDHLRQEATFGLATRIYTFLLPLLLIWFFFFFERDFLSFILKITPLHDMFAYPKPWPEFSVFTPHKYQ